MDATEYRAKMESILGSPMVDNQIRLNLKWNTAEEAKRLLAQIRQQQKELRFIKKEIVLDMKQLRSAYTAQKSEVQAGFWASLAGRKSAGHDRASKRENLRRQELNALSSYQVIASLIDNALVSLDGAKLKLDVWIRENK